MKRKNFEMEGKRTKSPCDPIIILSSDDDEDEDVEELFNEFLSKVERFVAQKEVVLLLKLKFGEARPEFVSSAKFKTALGWRTKQLNEKNGYIYTGDICNLLAANSKQDSCTSKSECEKLAVEIDLSSPGINNGARHSTREEADENIPIIQVTIDNLEDDKPATSEEKITTVVVTSQPSTSSATASTSTRKRTRSKLPLTPQKRRSLIRKLEGKLKHICERIKILNQAELSLDEMNMNDSTYIQECRLKDRFNRIWDRICKIRERPSDTGRVTEKEVKCPQTGYPEIDRAMNKFLKTNKGRFPDRFDIKNVFLETNKKHGLKMTPQVLNEIVDDVFVKIGNKLQKRRKRDLVLNFGCFLTDNYLASNDPALNNPALLKKLEENKRVSKRSLDEVFNKYTHYGRMRNRGDTDDSSSSESENAEPEDRIKGKRKGKFSHISVAESSDSSDSECDDFGLEIVGTDDNDPAKTEEQSTVIETHSDSSESDLDDFVIRRSHRVTERTQLTESETDHDDENSTELQSNQIDLGSNCAVVELPSSVLAESTDISVEQTSIAEIQQCSTDTSRSTQQQFEAETMVAPGGNQKQAVLSVLEDHEVTSVQGIPQCNNLESKRVQNSDSGEKLDSNLDEVDSVSTAGSPGSRSVPTAVVSSDDRNSVLTDSVQVDSSDSFNRVDDEVSTEKCSNENGKHEICFLPSRNGNSIASRLSDKPSLVIPLTPVSLKGGKSCLLSPCTKKRKAENGLLDYESPLKIFRNATLEIVGKKNDFSKTDTSKQKASCEESVVSARSEHDEQSVALINRVPATVNGHSLLRKNVPRKLALSLKSGRNSTKKQDVPVNVSDVIVLSDDDSDS